jgi:uncharacterized protein (TIGR00251 family)
MPDPRVGALLEIRVIPRANRNEVGGERNGRLLVRTTATPVDGKANRAVCKQVADYLGVPVSRVEIVSGQNARDKTLRITR